MRQAEPDTALDPAQESAAARGMKGMIPIGRPFLDYCLSALADAGFEEVCLVIGPEHHAVREYYEAPGRLTRIAVTFAVQEEPRGTADAVLAAEAFAGGHRFLVCNSDNYYPVDVLARLRALDGPGLAGFAPAALVGIEQHSRLARDPVRPAGRGTGRHPRGHHREARSRHRRTPRPPHPGQHERLGVRAGHLRGMPARRPPRSAANSSSRTPCATPSAPSAPGSGWCRWKPACSTSPIAATSPPWPRASRGSRSGSDRGEPARPGARGAPLRRPGRRGVARPRPRGTPWQAHRLRRRPKPPRRPRPRAGDRHGPAQRRHGHLPGHREPGACRVHPRPIAGAPHRALGRLPDDGGAPDRPQLPAGTARRRPRARERPPLRLRHEQFQRPRRGHLPGARRGERTPGDRRLAGASRHPRSARGVPRLHRERPELRPPRRRPGRRHLRGEPGPHRDRLLPRRAGQPVFVRPRHLRGRHALARRHGTRRRRERRAVPEVGAPAGGVQPAVARDARDPPEVARGVGLGGRDAGRVPRRSPVRPPTS